MHFQLILTVLSIMFVHFACAEPQNFSQIQSSEMPSLDKGFSVKNDRLFDYTGNEFVIRGINMPFAYYYDKSLSALDQAKSDQFNAVRIIWCADNLVRSGRCENKDFRNITDLARALEKMRQLELVAVMNLQNATGSDNPEHLSLLVDWYLSSEVKSLLKAYEDMLIINVANEWFGSWEDPSNILVDTYQREIKRLRDGGISHVLIIDAGGWGQQFSTIPKLYSKISPFDINILYSSHMYDLFPNAEVVENSFNIAENLQIPLLIGEFGCTHYIGQKVACDAIMKNAEARKTRYGYLAWSFSGNGGPLQQLDLYESSDWKTLTSYGRFVVEGSNFGIRKTAHTACLFPGQVCANELQ